MMRVGIGYDIHRLVEGRPLILGGERISFEKGLLGHSDADALAHAIADAILGGSALGDIGQHFSDTDARFKDADSMILLRAAADLALRKGYSVVNVDANIVAQAPKLAPYIETMRCNIARTLGMHLDTVSVKARTNEGLGPEGRGEAISVQAVVLLEE